jgi:hypothetical protein
MNLRCRQRPIRIVGGGAGFIAPACPDPLEASSPGLIALADGSTSLEDKGPTTRKCCAMFLKRASKCVPLVAHLLRASARNFPIKSSSSDHTCSPSLPELFRRPFRDLLVTEKLRQRERCSGTVRSSCHTDKVMEDNPRLKIRSVHCFERYEPLAGTTSQRTHLEVCAAELAAFECAERAYAEPGRSRALRVSSSAHIAEADGSFLVRRLCFTVLSTSLLLTKPSAVTSEERARRTKVSALGFSALDGCSAGSDIPSALLVR